MTNVSLTATSGLSRGRLVLVCQVAIVLIALCLWQFSPSWAIDDALVSRPLYIMGQTLAWLKQGLLQKQAAATLATVFWGLLWGAVLGVSTGIVAGLWRFAERLIEPVLAFLFALPKSAFVPLFILWFGIGAQQHIVFTAAVVFFFFFFSTLNGMKAVPASLDAMLSLLDASLIQRLRVLYLPASFAWLLAGLRLAMPHAFVAAVTAEIIASRSGLGNLVKSSSSAMDAAGMFSALLCLLTLSVASTWAVMAIAAKSRWKTAR
jgi:NitT/TauT family transport system permease protein